VASWNPAKNLRRSVHRARGQPVHEILRAVQREAVPAAFQVGVGFGAAGA